MEKINVRIADMKIGKSPDIMVSYGIGSCVVVSIFDRKKKIGGVLHFVLPEYKGSSRIVKNPYRYGAIGIKLMIKKLVAEGASKDNLVAKIAGGSVMFPGLLKNPGNAIGKRNIEIARKVLSNEKIKIEGEDTGGDYGRSVEFDLDTGILRIRSYKGGERSI